MRYVMSRRAALAGMAGTVALSRIPWRALPRSCGSASRRGKLGQRAARYRHGIRHFREARGRGRRADLCRWRQAGAGRDGRCGRYRAERRPRHALCRQGCTGDRRRHIADTAAFMGISVGAQSPARGIDDLKGKKIGVTSQGSTTFWWSNNSIVPKAGKAMTPRRPWSSAAIQSRVCGLEDGRHRRRCRRYLDRLSTRRTKSRAVAHRLLGIPPPIELYVIFASTALVQRNPQAVLRLRPRMVQFDRFHEEPQSRKCADRREGHGLYAGRGRSYVRAR